MSNIHPNVDDHFKDMRDQIIARMIKDGALLMYLNREWYNNPSDCNDSGCLSFISEGYAVNIKKL